MVPSMRENWTKGLDAVDSEWVTVIGDDDCLCPSLLEMLDEIDIAQINVDAVSWAQISYDIPNEIAPGVPHRRPAKIPVNSKTILDNPQKSLARELAWESKFNKPPRQIVGLYHGAVKMDRIRQIREVQGKYFNLDVVDFDIGYHLSKNINRRVLTGRPFSINGHSIDSNSWAISLRTAMQKRHEQWLQENKQQDGWSTGEIEYFMKHGVAPEFFFSLPLVLWGFTRAFSKIHRLKIDENVPVRVLKCLIREAQFQHLQEDYEWYLCQVKSFAKAAFPGKTIKFPSTRYYSDFMRHNEYYGFANDTVYLDRSSVGYDYELFCKVAFGMQAHPRHCFNRRLPEEIELGKFFG